MNIWLDDNPIKDPNTMEWKICRTSEACINLLKYDSYEIIDLDHDLGPEDTCGSGMDVLKYLLNVAIENGKIPCKEIRIHTSNPVRHIEMLMIVEDIDCLCSQNQGKK